MKHPARKDTNEQKSKLTLTWNEHNSAAYRMLPRTGMLS